MLVLVWVLLWGTFSWANLLSGLLVALTVLTLLPLPHVVGGSRVRPLPLLAFLGHFVVDLFASGAEVAWQALRPGGVRQTAIVQVQLRADSDLLLTMVAAPLLALAAPDTALDRCALGVAAGRVLVAQGKAKSPHEPRPYVGSSSTGMAQPGQSDLRGLRGCAALTRFAM